MRPRHEPAVGQLHLGGDPDAVANSCGQEVFYSDGLPIEFSWPIQQPGRIRISG